MPNFKYTAVDQLGERMTGTAVAESEDALADVLREQGQYLVEAKPAAAAGVDLSQVRLFEGIKRRDVILLTTQLATVTGTGGSVVEGLADIEQQVSKQGLKRVVTALRRDIERGMSLSAALARHPKAFNDLYVNIVKAGEASGKLDATLEDLARQLDWQEDLASRIRDAAIYPILVVVMLSVLGVVLVGFTIPRFLQVYERLGSTVELPLPTRALMAVSSAIRHYWDVGIAALITTVVGVRLYRQTPDGSVRSDRWLLRLPVVGELLRKVAFSRFAHFFGTLHDAGLEVVPSLALMERLIGNAYLSQQFRRAVDRVMAGDSLSSALQRVGEFPPVVINMIALGERTGRMSKALANVSRYFDREVDRTVKNALTLFGPIMLVVLAGVFVVMALAFYLPLFGLLRGIR
jgi:type IV pilus assembly protein PilC